MSGGWNPVTGRDSTGDRPNFAPYGAPTPSQNGAYIQQGGGPGYTYGTMPQYYFYPSITYAAGGQYIHAMPYAQGYAQPTYYAAQPQYYAQQPNGMNNAIPRQGQVHPNIDTNMPAAQFTNSSGGVGCEPGYNYFFPPLHTKVHVFKSNTPPWQLPISSQLQFKAIHVPCGTTCAELLKGFGCTNSTAKKNRCYELISGGGGKWYRGLEVNGQDKDMLKKSIRDIGWDETRTGLPNQKPVVCLWFCKD